MSEPWKHVDEISARYQRFIRVAATARGYGVSVWLPYGLTVRVKRIEQGNWLFRNWTVLDDHKNPIVNVAEGRQHLLSVRRVGKRKPSPAEVERALRFADFVPCYCDGCAAELENRTSLMCRDGSEYTHVPLRNGREMSLDLWNLRRSVAVANGIDVTNTSADERIDAVLAGALTAPAPAPAPVRKPYKLDLRTLIVAAA